MENENEYEEMINFAKQRSQEILDKGEEIMPMCMAYRKDDTIEIIGVLFQTENKEEIRLSLKRHLLGKPLQKYMVVFDAKMTMYDPKDMNKAKVMDTVLITIYTPQNKMMRAYPYSSNKKLKENEVIKMDGRDKMFDCWDIWGEEVPFNDKEQNKYQNFKDDNPDLYRGLDKKLDKDRDKIKEVKEKGKLERVEMALNFHMDIYRYKNKSVLEVFNGAGKNFISTKVIDDKNFEEKIEELKNILERIK